MHQPHVLGLVVIKYLPKDSKIADWSNQDTKFQMKERKIYMYVYIDKYEPLSTHLPSIPTQAQVEFEWINSQNNMDNQRSRYEKQPQPKTKGAEREEKKLRRKRR